MALPTSYLTTQRNLEGILTAIQTAKAPSKFTQTFLAGLGYKSSSDRLVIKMLKTLGFLSEEGVPSQRYFDYLDQSQSRRVMAEGVMDAYGDLFDLNVNAQNMSRSELKNKMRTLGQGKLTDGVLDKMAMTFTAFAKQADFEAAKAMAGVGGAAPVEPPPPSLPAEEGRGPAREGGGDPVPSVPSGGGLAIDGLVYNIQIQLPESRDPKVYDALFESLAKHLRA
jgi:Family of unknown function (DUF5343)